MYYYLSNNAIIISPNSEEDKAIQKGELKRRKSLKKREAQRASLAKRRAFYEKITPFNFDAANENKEKKGKGKVRGLTELNKVNSGWC